MRPQAQGHTTSRALRLAAALLLLSGGLPAAGQLGSTEYVVGPKDLLEIKVLEIPDLNVERRVLDNGSIDLPLLGQVPVAGTTSMEIRDRLAALLTAKYVNQAYVTVMVKDYANRPITLLGGVARPGTLSISGRWTLRQAILSAGGVAPGAGRQIFVLRTADNGLSDRLEINADELFVRMSPEWDIPIYPGDVVSVPVKQEITIYVIGELKQNGAVKVTTDEKVTLLTFVARAGGFTDKAAKGSLRIRRTGPDGTVTELKANYGRILAGKDPDIPLQAEDVVIVKESLF